MKYAKIIDDKVIQTQPNNEDGFIEVEENVVCGMIKDGDNFIVTPKSQEQIQLDINNEALAYLLKTDWYIIRLQETGIEVPTEILTLRQEAREKIV